MKPVAASIRLRAHRSNSGVTVWIGASRDQQANKVEVAALCSKTQRRVGHRVRLVHVRIGPSVEKLPSDVVMAAPAGVAECSPPTRILLVKRRAEEQRLEDFSAIARTNRKHERVSIIDRVWLDGWHEA